MPNAKAFSLAEATLLEQGKYHDLQEEEENAMGEKDGKADPKLKNQSVYIGRDNLENELKLEEFEQAIQ